MSTNNKTIPISNVPDQLLIQFFGDDFIALSIRNNVLESSLSGLLSELNQTENIKILSDFNQEIVKVAFDTPKFTLVPDEFFDPNKLGDFLIFNNPVSFAERLLFNPIVDLQANISYAVDFNKINLIQSIFPKAKFFHSFLPMWNCIHGLTTKDSPQTFFMQISRDAYEISYIKDGALEFYNRFSFDGIEEFIYFPIFLAEQFSLKANKTRIVCLGSVDLHPVYLNELSKYFLEIEIVDESDLGFLISNVASSFVPKISSTLFLSRCE